MSTNRRTRSWPLKPQISPDALARFLELEHMPRGHRNFKDKSHELARLLDLVSEWWTCNDVNDCSPAPCHPPGHIARDDWFWCRRIRRALLAAASPSKPAKGAHAPHLSQ
jgi:hypothetical protein